MTDIELLNYRIRAYRLLTTTKDYDTSELAGFVLRSTRAELFKRRDDACRVLDTSRDPDAKDKASAFLSACQDHDARHLVLAPGDLVLAPGDLVLAPEAAEHSLTLEFHRVLSETEWRDIAKRARQLPYVQHLHANKPVDRRLSDDLATAATELGSIEAHIVALRDRLESLAGVVAVISEGLRKASTK